MRQRCWLVDSKGLVVAGRDRLTPAKMRYANPHEFLPDLETAVDVLKPTALSGVSGQPKTFTQPIIEAMARHNERPIIFALSNPSSKAECTAEEAYTWSDGRAIFASGSPFAPVKHKGKTHVPGQCNNSYVFPGIALGAIACGVTELTDEMFFAAAKTLSDIVSDNDLSQGRIFPPLSDIREVSLRLAVAVAEVAYERGLTREPRPADLFAFIKEQMFKPDYVSYV